MAYSYVLRHFVSFFPAESGMVLGTSNGYGIDKKHAVPRQLVTPEYLPMLSYLLLDYL